jgi:hypothetical protein
LLITRLALQAQLPSCQAWHDGSCAWRANRVISKRFCKKQQMAWTPRGAHLLLQIRTRVLNGDWEATFREWYQGFRAAPQQVAA